MTEIYQFKIVAIGIKPIIERILWIKSTATFWAIYLNLIAAEMWPLLVMGMIIHDLPKM